MNFGMNDILPAPAKVIKVDEKEDEPFFILRAQDKNGALALAYYRKLCTNPFYKTEVDKLLSEFVNFAHMHPELIEEPNVSYITQRNKAKIENQ